MLVTSIKTLSLNIVTLQVKALTYGFGENTYIHSIITLLFHLSLTLVLRFKHYYSHSDDAQKSEGIADVQRSCICQGWKFSVDVSTTYLYAFFYLL